MDKPATILYIEDDSASRRLVQRVLGSRGYQVLVAGDGLEGITLARQQHPQLILMDINLPSMDGREITTRLRSLPHFANVPIVALTANSSPGSRELALAAGCTGYLTKPIDVGAFPGQVEDFLQGRVEPLTADERSEHLQVHAQNLVMRLENKIQELEVANQQLRELDRLKSDFIVLVSHELRTPLTLISGYSHLLSEHLKQAGEMVPATLVAADAQGLSAGVTRMREVVNEIIGVARIAAGTLDLALGPVRLSEVIEDVFTDLRQVCHQRRLNMQIGELKRLPVIEGDGAQLRTALGQVLGNAVKYTPDGGNIFVVGRVVDNRAVDLIVRDTGIGIPPDDQRRIFEQFYVLGAIQHHSTSKSAFQGGGLGLGLAIAKGIVEAHNGRIWVESERRDPDRLPGSTFHILLPISQASQEPAF